MLFFLSTSLVGQKKYMLSEFIELLSEKYQIDVAIDPALLNHHSINVSTISNENILGSLDVLFSDAGLDYYFLDKNQLLLRKSNSLNTAMGSSILMRGKILDEKSGEPLAFASVYTTNFLRGTTSDAHGHFMLELEPEVSDSIEISYLGYHKQKISISADESISIRLKPQQLTFEKITIIAAKQHLYSGMRGEYNGQFHNYTYTNPAGTDIYRSIQKLSGISKTDNASVGIRGYGSNKTLTLLDNIPVLNTGHYYNLISGVNELYFDEFSLYKNQYSSVFGNALGGLVSFKSENQPEYKVRTTSNLLYSGIALALQPAEKIEFRAGARLSYLGINNKGILSSNFNQLNFDTNTDNPGILSGVPVADFFDLNFKIKYAYNEKGFLEINALRGNDETGLTWESKRNLMIQNQNVSLTQYFSNSRQLSSTGASLKHFTSIGKNTNLTTDLYTYSYSDSFLLNNQNLDFINGIEHKILSTYKHKQKVDYTVLKTTLAFIPSGKSEWRGGIEIAHFSQTLGVEENTMMPLLLDQQMLQPAIYSEYLYHYNGWKLSGGIRFLKPVSFDRYYLQPQLSASYNAGPNFEIKAGYADRVQNFNQLDFETRFTQNLKYFYISEDNFLPLQKSKNYMTGFRWSGGAFMMDIEAWIQHSNGSQLFTSLNTDNRNGPPVPFNYTFYSGENFSKGIDLNIAFHSGNIHYSLAYTLSKNTQQFSGIYQDQLILSPDDRRHQLTFGLDANFNNWIVNSSFTCLSGTPYLSFDKSRNLGPKDKSPRKDVIEYLPPYLSWDAGITRQLNIGKMQLGLGLTVSNITNHTNVRFIQQTGEFDAKKNTKPIVTGNQSLMLGRFFNLHVSSRF